MKKTILNMLDNAVDKFADNVYLANKSDSGWDEVTFKQTKDIAISIGKALKNRGLTKGDCFTIISEGRSEWVLTELATIMIGGISVPLSLKLLTEEIPVRVNHSESKVIVLSHITIDKVLAAKDLFERDLIYIYLDDDEKNITKLVDSGLIKGENLITYKELLEEGRTITTSLDTEIHEDDVITICYTSGTTGNPKGIMLTHKNYWANCTNGMDMAKIPDNKSMLVILPIDHSFAHTVALYAAYVVGQALYFVDARGGSASILRNIPKNLSEVNPYYILTVPALTGNFMKKMKSGVMAKGGFIAYLFEKGLEAGIKYHGNGFDKKKIFVKNMCLYRLSQLLIYPKLRAVFGKEYAFAIGGGALLDINQQEFFNAIGAPVYQGYGLSEASPIISTNAAHRHKFGTSGNILDNIELKIVKGEIVIKGDNVMKGYLKNDGVTKETIRDGWLYTGDLGYVDDDGFLMVTGRAKALLISKDGEKYSPEEIEETIVSSQNLISQVMLYCDHNNYTTCLLTVDPAVIKTLNPNSPEDLLNIIQEKLNICKSKFPSMWTPSTFQLITEHFSDKNTMVNSSMKMVRYKITEVYKDSIDYMYGDAGKKYINEKNINTAKEMLV